MEDISKLYFDYSQHDSYMYMRIIDNKIDIFDVPAMSKHIHTIFEKIQYPNLIIDMRNVLQTDSTGIGLLISLMTRCKKFGNEAVLLCNDHQLNTNLKVTKIESFFPVFTSLEEAEKYFIL